MSAATDQSLRSAFKPLVQSAVDARRQILREFQQVPREIIAAMAGLARAQGGTFRGATAEARAAYREQVALARAAAREQLAAAREAERAAVALERDRVAATRRAAREMAAEHRAIARQAAVVQRRNAVELDRFATRTSYHSARFLTPHMPIASFARRAASEVARGFGVDPTVSGAFQRNVELETLAQQASNSARLAGQTVSPSVIEERVRSAADKRGMSRTDTAAGVFGYQKLTGDLQGGLDMLDRMVERSAATSTNVEDFAAAMGNVSNALGDIPDKQRVILDIMDAITAQGARGAVEVSDMATHMARVAAAANRFGGDTARNIKLAGAITQIARAEGGAPSAAEAARSIVGFANTFQKSARLKEFQQATGKSAFVEGSGNTQLRGMDELIKDALVATGGDLNKMNKIFMDVIGGRAVAGFTKDFNRAGGGEKGLAAVDAKIAKFMDNAALSQRTLDELNAQREQTTAAKAQKFQNQLDDVAKRLQASLLPALEAAAPSILKFVTAMGDAAAWAVGNPGKAIAAAIVASIARAGIESLLRAALERAIIAGLAGSVGRGAVGSVGAAAGGALATAGGAAAGAAGAGGAASAGAAGAAGLSAGAIGGAVLAGTVGSAAALTSFSRRVGADKATKEGLVKRHLIMQGMQFLGPMGLATVGLLEGGSALLDATGFGDKPKRTVERKTRQRTFDGPKDEVTTWVAKDPGKTSRADMEAAYKRGGVAELEKIASLQGKQENWQQKLFEQGERQTQLLAEISDKFTPQAGNSPTTDPNSTGYQQ